MLVSKSFIVTGETIHRNGAYEKNIAIKVDEVINSYLEANEGEYVDLKIDTKVTPQVGTDVAFITIVLKKPDIEKKKESDEDEIVFSKKKK